MRWKSSVLGRGNGVNNGDARHSDMFGGRKEEGEAKGSQELWRNWYLFLKNR